MQVRVIVRDDKGATVHDRQGNYGKNHFRDWIAKTTCWALNNGCGVISYPVENPAAIPPDAR